MPAAWGRVPIWWSQRLRGRGAGVLARDVLIVLAAHAGRPNGRNPGLAWPSIDQIANTLCVTPKRVQNAIAELKAAGLVKVQARNRRLRETNLYELAVGDGPFQVPDSSTQNKSESGAQSGHPRTQDFNSLGAHLDTDQVPDSVPNQFSNSCSNGADNRPIEPTIEPSVLTSFVPAGALRARPGRKRQREGDEERDQGDLLRLIDALTPGLADAYPDEERVLRAARGHARRLVTVYSDSVDRQRLAGNLEAIFADPAFAGLSETMKIDRAIRMTGDAQGVSIGATG